MFVIVIKFKKNPIGQAPRKMTAKKQKNHQLSVASTFAANDCVLPKLRSNLINLSVIRNQQFWQYACCTKLQTIEPFFDALF